MKDFNAKEIQDMGAKICKRYFDEKDDDNACHNCPFNDEACITSGGELVCWQEQTELFTDFIKRIETMVNKIIKEAADG